MTPVHATTSTPLSRQKQRIGADALRPGMWVVELDRPWLDTPFMVTGFRIQGDTELATLRRFCRHAWVDPERSDAELRPLLLEMAQADTASDESATWMPGRPEGWPADVDPDQVEHVVVGLPEEQRRAPAAPLPTGRPAAAVEAPAEALPARADVQISDDTRNRFFRLIDSVSGAARDAAVNPIARAFGWLRRSSKEPAADASSGPATTLQVNDLSRELVSAWLPGITLGTWEDRLSMERAMPLARQLHARADQQLRTLCRDVSEGRLPQLEPVRRVVNDMVDAMVDNADALAWVSRLRGGAPDAHGHGVQVAVYLIALGRHLGLPKTQLSYLGLIGMLADLGKARLPQALLAKPGMLTPDEFKVIREHVQLGLDALSLALPLPPQVEQGIAQHHERLDGSGYPLGLKDGQIGIWGRMAAIADCFAALVAPRPYAPPQSPQDALMSLYEWAGRGFHEALLEQFVQAVGLYPVGTLVELSTGEIAVVIAQHRGKPLVPRVAVLTRTDRSPLPVALRRDLRALQKENRDDSAPKIVRGLPWGAHGLRPREDVVETARPPAPGR